MLCFIFATSILAVTCLAGTIVVNVGQSTTLPCFNDTAIPRSSTEVCWKWSGEAQPGHQTVENGSLVLRNVTTNTSGTYTCLNQNDDSVIASYRVLVPGPPSGPANLTATETDRVVLLRWHNTYTQEYLDAASDTAIRIHYRPLVHFISNHSHYKPEPRQPWRLLPYKIHPRRTHVFIQEVKESSSYRFEVWAENSHGASPIATVTTTTKHQPLEKTSSAWERNKAWLVTVVALLGLLNVIAGIAWLLHCDNTAKKRRNRHRAIGNHSGLSGECEQLELVCHAHDSSLEGSSLTLPHHAALV